MTEGDVAFSSRFMPNVKFRYDVVADKLFSELPNVFMFGGEAYYGYSTDSNGKLFDGYEDEVLYNNALFKEVSIFEAIPELVPGGMIYDPVTDKLVKKVCVNQMHQGEFCDCDDSHSFTEHKSVEKQSDIEFILTHMSKYRFTYEQCEFVLRLGS